MRNRASHEEVCALAADLPSLAPAALRLLSGRKPGPITTYLELQADASALEVTSEAAQPFRRKFNGYYGVRRNAAWRAQFYAQFEAAKRCQREPDRLFEAVLQALASETGRVEASFVSKLVATLQPAAPVIDSVIRGWLAARVAAPPFAASTASAYFIWLADTMARLAATRQAQEWSQRFDAVFADIEGAASIDPVKKLDFLIWGGARG